MTNPLAARGQSAAATVKPLSGHIGAEITGIDISEPLTPEAVETIDQALLRWKVVFFRNQRLDHAAHIAFGRQFGELTHAHPHASTTPDGFPEIYTVDERAEQFGARPEELTRVRKYHDSNDWHTDVTSAINPPAGSILRAGVVPPYGGDTTFTNLVAAYQALADPVQCFLDGLRAEHCYTTRFSLRERSKSFTEKIEKNPTVAHHPVVRVHPRTGEKALFVNPAKTDHILGVSPFESRWILEFLFDHLSRTEFTVRLKWEPGSVAFWDNRATAHLPPQDLGALGEVERVLYRVTLIGDVPVGPDGRQSELIEGAPLGAEAIFTS
jgi:taurine dioxygenase